MEQGFRLEKIFDKYALYDKNNNHWFLDKFTIEQSIKASKSLVDCFECANCVNCKNCWHCHRCVDCNGCNVCWDCKGCVKCYRSKNCTTCYECQFCENCAGCVVCKKCENLQDTHYHNNNKPDETYWREQNNAKFLSKQQERARRQRK